MSVNWSYFDKFEALTDKYLPVRGEGETKATQIVTAICKLVYKWYNDGDVFDNTHEMSGWCNDLSDYANWLYKHTDTKYILDGINDCFTDSDYEDLLKDLTDALLDVNYLAEQNEIEKVDTIYNCEGKYKFVEHYEEDEEWDDDWYDDDDDEEEDDDDEYDY